LAVLVAGLVAVVRLNDHLTRDRFDRAVAGDCVVDDLTRTPSYRLVPCTDPAAGFRVLAVLDESDGGDKSCQFVAGASTEVSIEQGDVCLGRADVDPETAVNAADEGDCLRLQRPPVRDSEPLRLDCSDSRANYRVLARRTDLSSLDYQYGDDPCANVPGAVTSHAWTWRSPGMTFGRATILCLGPHDPDGPECAAVSPADMALAVISVVGRPYAVSSREWTAPGTCEYRFDGDDIVRITRTKEPYHRGSGDDEVVLRDARGFWRTGDRSLAVGPVTVTVHLTGVGDEESRRIAAAVYGHARGRLS
jgi:hypothetical protein